MSLTGSASRTNLSLLANGIWELHAGCHIFLRVLSVAKIGYIPQFKASNARDQEEVSSDLARMVRVLSITVCKKKKKKKKKMNQEIVSDRGCFFGILSLERHLNRSFGQKSQLQTC